MPRQLDDYEIRRMYHEHRRALRHGSAALCARMLSDYYAEPSNPIPAGRDRAVLVAQWDATSDRMLDLRARAQRFHAQQQLDKARARAWKEGA